MIHTQKAWGAQRQSDKCSRVSMQTIGHTDSIEESATELRRSVAATNSAPPAPPCRKKKTPATALAFYSYCPTMLPAALASLPVARRRALAPYGLRAYSDAAKVPFDLIKALRLKTKAGLMDCKDALAASNLDLAKAEDWLKERAKVIAAKKSDRTAAEGLIATITDKRRKRALLLEVCFTFIFKFPL